MKHYLTLSIKDKLNLLQQATQRFFYNKNLLLLEDQIKTWLRMLHLDSYYSLDSVYFNNSIQATVYLRKSHLKGHSYKCYQFRYSS